MTAQLRIASTANPGQRVNINMPGGEESGILSMMPGTMSEQATGNGRVQTTFQVFAKTFPINLRTAVNGLDSLFERARQIAASGGADDLIVVQMSSKNEGVLRQARVYGGRVDASDGAIVNAHLERNAGIFTITLERDELWNYSGAPTEQTWTAVNGLGGVRELAATITDGTAPGLVELMRIDPRTGSFSEAWVGIKPNLVGDLSAFDPVCTIASTAAQSSKHTIRAVNSFKAPAIYSLFIDGGGTEINWRVYDDSDNLLPTATVEANINYHQMLYAPLRSWNSSAATAANRKQWIGKYRVLMRWAGTLRGAKFAFRLSSGWAGGGQYAPQTTLPPVYKAAPGGLEFHMVQLGMVTVGGALFGAAGQRRNVIDAFALGLDVAIVGLDPADAGFRAAVEDAQLYVDKLILVPAEHTFHARYGAGEINAGYQMEYQSQGPEQQAVVVSTTYATPAEWMGGAGQVVDTVPEFDVNNFVTPTEDGSVLVLVTDRPWGQTQALSATRLASLAVTKRTHNYAD